MSKKTENNNEEFNWHRDTPFYEEKEYNGTVGNGKETYLEDTYSEEQKTEWLKNN